MPKLRRCRADTLSALWYARHNRRGESNPKHCRNEEDWSRRLKELMRDEGIAANCEEWYPAPPKRRCDLVIQWPDLGRIWLEAKGAWRHEDANGGVKNRNFRKHLRAAADDLNKLLTVGPANADHIGMLLVGFDTTEEPITEEDIELIKSRCVRRDWIEQQSVWPDANRRHGRIRLWLWMTEAQTPQDMFDAAERGEPPDRE